jgi:hypothetical protein
MKKLLIIAGILGIYFLTKKDTDDVPEVLPNVSDAEPIDPIVIVPKETPNKYPEYLNI